MAYELIKVSELPELTTPSDPNVLPIQDGDYLKRISFENLKEAATGDVAGDLAAEVTARESAVSGEATARGNADTAILADLASPYSASATYAVGDYCTKDGVLKRCNTAITTAEAWNSAHWDDAKLGGDVSTLRSALNSKIDEPTERVYIGTVTRGYWQQNNGATYANSYALMLSAMVEPNKTYYASGTLINSSFPLIVLFDANDNVIGTKESSGDSVIYNDYEFTTPSNCVRLSVNARAKGATAANYPCLYSIEYVTLDGDDISNSLNNKQTKAIKWIKATYTYEDDKYCVLNGGKLIISSNAGTSFSYARLTYDKTKEYRFYAACRTSTIPSVVCCDSNNEIIKIYDDTADTTIKAKEYNDIPEETYYIYVNGYSTLKARIEEATEREVTSLQVGKKGVFFGDSITQGLNVFTFKSTPFEDYPSVVGNLLGCTSYNGGLGGSTFASGRSIDFKNVVDCIVSGDFSTVLDGITQYGLNGSATRQYNVISTLDFSEIDFVSIALGTNDWNFGASIQAVKDAMSYCLEKLITNYPNLKIYVFTPIYRFNINNSGEDADTYVNTTSNITLHQMCEAIIETAQKFNVPVKDMFYNCNINQYNKILYMGDGTHPNANGYALMGEKIGKFINAN